MEILRFAQDDKMAHGDDGIHDECSHHDDGELVCRADVYGPRDCVCCGRGLADLWIEQL